MNPAGMCKDPQERATQHIKMKLKPNIHYFCGQSGEERVRGVQDAHRCNYGRHCRRPCIVDHDRAAPVSHANVHTRQDC